MAQFDEQYVRKQRKGERIGLIATVLCGAAVVFFTVGFIVSSATNDDLLFTLTMAIAPALAIITVIIAAYCSLTFGRRIDKAINDYIRRVFLENAAAMHPERENLSYYVQTSGTTVTVHANSYTDKIAFDFSVFGRLSLSRKSTVLNAVANKLCLTFFTLYERGAHFKNVEYVAVSSKQKKKRVAVIVNGVPDVKTYKHVMRSKN